MWNSISFNLAVLVNVIVAFFYPFPAQTGLTLYLRKDFIFKQFRK
jgi:hypothetical protein